MQILFQILLRTPLWVYGLFLRLLILGYLQSKPREVSAWRLGLLPLALGGFSLAQAWTFFGAQAWALAAWGAGMAAAVLAHRAFRPPVAARWYANRRRFHVPGSWVPLALMMAMFFTRYALAVGLVMRPALVQSSAFASAACLGLGLLSGLFFARALGVWSTRANKS